MPRRDRVSATLLRVDVMRYLGRYPNASNSALERKFGACRKWLCQFRKCKSKEEMLDFKQKRAKSAVPTHAARERSAVSEIVFKLVTKTQRRPGTLLKTHVYPTVSQVAAAVPAAIRAHNKVARARLAKKKQAKSSHAVATVEIRERDAPMPISTCRDIIHKLGFRGYARRKTTSRDPEKQIARKKFCAASLTRLRKDPALARGMIFSDETFVDTNDHSQRFVLARSREEADEDPRVQENVRCIPRVMVWGAIGHNWRSELVVIKPRTNEEGDMRGLTARRYKLECLSPIREKLKSKGILFMQDGARVHTAKEVQRYLDTQSIDWIRDWPASSPNLNPIEEIWEVLKRAITAKVLSRGHEIEDKDDLFEVAKQCWREIPVDVMNNHVLSYKRELQDCHKRGGRS